MGISSRNFRRDAENESQSAGCKNDNKVIAVIDLRHHINHPILGTWGGHCGYSSRPSACGKGYAKEMRLLNIQNAKAFGIPKLLVSCASKNNASKNHTGQWWRL